MIRVFVPATLPMLAELHQTARLLADGGIGYAMTPALREWYADGDAEELEYAALTEAARASLALLAADPTASRQRAVVAADVTGAVPDARHGRAAVRLTGPVGLAQVAALHVDGVDAAGTVQAAVEASDAAAAGDADAAIAVAEPESFELLWFATQELPDLLQG